MPGSEFYSFPLAFMVCGFDLRDDAGASQREVSEFLLNHRERHKETKVESRNSTFTCLKTPLHYHLTLKCFFL